MRQQYVTNSTPLANLLVAHLLKDKRGNEKHTMKLKWDDFIFEVAEKCTQYFYDNIFADKVNLVKFVCTT